MFSPTATGRFLRFSLLVAGLGLGGCVGPPSTEEDAARRRADLVREVYALADNSIPLEALRPDSPLEQFVLFAVHRHPAVAAAWHDWQAALADIVPARALPDPRLTFEADVASELMSFMPGLMLDLMNGGTRAAMGQAAAREADASYRAFATQVQGVAVEVRRAWIELVHADEALALHAAMLAAYDDAAATAAADYRTATSMASLETQIRLLDTARMHHTEHHATAEVRSAARLRFKSALGLLPEDPDPAWPAATLTASELPSRSALWAQVRARNPELAQMQAMVDAATAEVAVAERRRHPEFSLGAMIDLKANPLMVRPTASLSLPWWRDKIAAYVDAAQARREAARARVSSTELDLAARLASAFARVQETDEMLDYLDTVALPNLATVTGTAEAGYRAGQANATMIVEARAMTLQAQVRRLDVLRDRELAAADLLMLTGSAAPALGAEPNHS